MEWLRFAVAASSLLCLSNAYNFKARDSFFGSRAFFVDGLQLLKSCESPETTRRVALFPIEAVGTRVRLGESLLLLRMSRYPVNHHSVTVP